jgi:hypothetical protein
MKKKVFLFIFVIVLNLIVRTFFAVSTKPQGDILVHLNWAQTLYQQGLSGSYFSLYWTYTPPTQPPLMMLAYYFSQSIYYNRNILSQFHNLVKFPPSSFLLFFQEYGEILSLRFWELIGTLLIAFIIYFYFSRKIGFKKSFIIFNLIIFNPITIFINSVWGQNDILPTAFMYASFLLLFSESILITPLVFLVGLMFKPTIAIVSLLFLVIFIYQHSQTKPKHQLFKYLLILISAIIFVYFAFKPFIPDGIRPIGYINDILHNRISTSSKGSKLASVSAFNIYSLIFNIDQTSALNQNSPFDLAGLSPFIFIIINLIFIFYFFKSKFKKFNHLLFTIFFISQGSFLFMTNMLDRYFIPAFIASCLIMVIYWKKFGFLMVIQQLIWFSNLIYAYYYRSSQNINDIFRTNNFLTIRFFSLLSIFVYFYLIKRYLRFTKTKEINT